MAIRSRAPFAGRCSRSQRALPPEVVYDGTGPVPAVTSTGYGLGLFVVHDLEIGTVIGHSGGYPGYGSNMRWHPGSGLGVVALANARYARVSIPAADALRVLVRDGAATVRRVRPAPATERLRAAAEELLQDWDDRLADAVFAPNMDLDEPRERRRAEVARLHARLGALGPDDVPPASDSPAHLRWWLRGEHGRLRVELLATAEAAPRIQSLELLVVPEPAGALAGLAERVVGLLDEELPQWPDDMPLAPAVDRAALARGLRAAALLLGSSRVGRPIGGDGERRLVTEVIGARGRGELRLEVDADGTVMKALVAPARVAAPPEAP